MNVRDIGRILAAALVVSACGVRRTNDMDNLTPVSQLHPAPPVLQFKGNYSPVKRTTSGSGMYAGSIRITGTVRLTRQPGTTDFFSMETDFTSPDGSQELRWSIVQGSCGSGAIPLVPARSLPPIVVPSDGRAHLTSEFRATLMPASTYHLNLYAHGGDQLADVVGCANLKAE